MRHFRPVLNIIGAVALTIMLFAAGVFVLPDSAIAAEQEEFTIEIASAEELKSIAYVINGGYISTDKFYYRLTADIDLSGLEDVDGEGWRPIGYQTFEQSIAFSGVFDGAGYTVSGLRINRLSETSGAGLFGYNTGIIKNLNIVIDEENGGINAAYYAGGITGINDGVISGCNVYGLINADYSGGICGSNKGTVSECVNYADIYGENGIGGIVGGNAGVISFCQNFGSVQGSEYSYDAGGIAGYVSTRGSSISNCANYGAVAGKENTGGIIGSAYGIEINNCANYGAVSGTETIGGIAGFSRAEIKNCLNTGKITGDSGIGGIAGKAPGGSVTNSFYLAGSAINIPQTDGGRNNSNNDEDSDNEDAYNFSEPRAENEIITRAFIELLNGGGSFWTLRAPDEFHYYPEINAFDGLENPKQYIKSGIHAYAGKPILNNTELIYGESLRKLAFNTDAEGVFFWQEPDKIYNAGTITAYLDFHPFLDNYGELYGIEIVLTVRKAQSVISITLDGWQAGMEANKPITEIAAGETSRNELIIEYKKRGAPDSEYSSVVPVKAGKYTVRATYQQSDNYLSGYAEYDFSITADMTWLIVLGITAGATLLLFAAIYFADKKLKFFSKLKKIFVREVVVEKHIEVIKYKEPEINTAALSEYVEKLTAREFEIAKKILEGKQRKSIAAELYIGERTVKTHIHNILQKTDCENQRIFALKFKV